MTMLEVLENAKKVHGDLRPNNIMIKVDEHKIPVMKEVAAVARQYLENAVDEQVDNSCKRRKTGLPEGDIAPKKTRLGPMVMLKVVDFD